MTNEIQMRVYECTRCEALVVHSGKPGEEVECPVCLSKRYVAMGDRLLGDVLKQMRDWIERISK